MPDKITVLLIGALYGSMAADVESTMKCYKTGYCREANTIMRPFVESGRGATYAIKIAGNTGILAMSMELKRRDKKYWWVPLAAMIGAQTAASVYTIK